MIGKLRGKLDEVSRDHVTVDVGGVGYLVFVSTSTISKMPVIGSEISLKIFMQVREDDISLYGFLTDEEKNWFHRLISVKGIGPRMGLVILSHLAPNDLLNAILSRDIKMFQNISGVGKKIAERIVTELKDNKAILAGPQDIDVSGASNLPQDSTFNDAILALNSLGYNNSECYKACYKIYTGDPSISLSELMKNTLKELSK
jgi:Holliday junction DNA helicase RuvA